MRQCGQIWLKLKAASKLISFQLIWFELKESDGEREGDREGGRERENEGEKATSIKQTGFSVKSFKLICDANDWRVEVGKHERWPKRQSQM